MRQALLVVDVQTTFNPPEWLVTGIAALVGRIPSVATVEIHNEKSTPFWRQLGWRPAANDHSLVNADHIYIKHGYCPSGETLTRLKQMQPDRVLVCGLQTETCALAAGFMLFDAGLNPTLITDLTVGSSLDPTGMLGIRLWKHHFRQTTSSAKLLNELNRVQKF